MAQPSNPKHPQLSNISEQEWQKQNQPTTKLSIEWVPISTFDLYAHAVISINEANTLDLNISGGELVVTKFTNEGDYRSVLFGSAEEFESYIRIELERFYTGVDK